MELINKDLCIRNARPEDAATLTTWWNDGAIMAHAGFPHGLNTSVETVRNQIINQDQTKHTRMMIVYQDRAIGEMSYRLLENKTAEIGIKICQADLRERGLGSQLLTMLLDYLFCQLGMDRVILDTDESNTRAQHVYEKLGFIQVGRRPGAFQDQDGNKRTPIDYELLSKNWTS